jgi:hypothetical protein
VTAHFLTVHVRVNDAAMGKPTPVRIRFRTPDGAYLAPFGRLTDFATGPGEAVGGSVRLGTERVAYIDGTCEIHLPPGPVSVEVHKGPEYAPLRREVTLGPGQISLRLAIERWTDLRKDGWYAGDTRAHYLSPHAALLEGAAEDLAVVNLLALEKPAENGHPTSLPNLLDFSGTRPAVEAGDRLVVVNTLNVHPLLGTVALLNCHRVVFPLRFGAPGPDNWSVADWCDQCHRKSGLVVWPDLPRLTVENPQGEALAALVLGKVDAYEVCRFDSPEPDVLGDWYRLLDCGLRVPLVGGSGKDSNAVALGCVRTYARLEPGQELSYGAWIEAVRAGRTFVTNGPLLTLTVDGQGPGAVLTADSPGRKVRVRAEVSSTVPVDQLELLANGGIIATKEASGNRLAAVVETDFLMKASGWLAARCWSRERMAGGATGQCVYAQTSPVYFQVEGRAARPDAGTVGPLLAVLDRTLGWVANEARCENEHQREHLLGTLQTARAALLP